jgi:hypothetical protein
MSPGMKEKKLFTNLAEALSGGSVSQQIWELQKTLFIGLFVTVVNGCKEEI